MAFYGDSGRDHISVGPCLISIDMPTAIVRVYTSEGFVVAADGRQVKDPDHVVVTDSLQKIFPVHYEGRALAYALCGTCLLSDDQDETTVWDLAAETANAVKVLAGRRSSNIAGYATRLSRPINKLLKAVKQNGRIAGYPAHPENIDAHGSTIADILLNGYFDGIPSSARIRFFHVDQRLVTPEVFLEPLHVYEISGSKRVQEIFFDATDERFAEYGKPMMTSAPTLMEAVAVAAGYIRACSTPEAIQIDEQCAGIGGHIHIATITPAGGFQWVEGFKPKGVE